MGGGGPGSAACRPGDSARASIPAGTPELRRPSFTPAACPPCGRSRPAFPGFR